MVKFALVAAAQPLSSLAGGLRAAPPLKWEASPPRSVVLFRWRGGVSVFSNGLSSNRRSPAALRWQRRTESRDLRFVCFSSAGDEGGTLSLDEKAEILFLGQFLATAAVLGVVFGITNSFRPFPEDIFRYDLREPFKLRDGWLLWAGVGFGGAVAAIALTGAASALFTGDNPQRDTDALVQLLPLIGSSTVSTAFLVGITGVLAPLLEETVFRGFLMASLTKWVPTPVAAVMSAAVFAVAHLTPGEFPQLFILGSVLGLSYAQTKNLLTPIVIHALWNSGVIILLTFLQLQGYDIRQLVQGS